MPSLRRSPRRRRSSRRRSRSFRATDSEVENVLSTIANRWDTEPFKDDVGKYREFLEKPDKGFVPTVAEPILKQVDGELKTQLTEVFQGVFKMLYKIQVLRDGLEKVQGQVGNLTVTSNDAKKTKEELDQITEAIGKLLEMTKVEEVPPYVRTKNFFGL